jgi:hypothetical protein
VEVVNGCSREKHLPTARDALVIFELQLWKEVQYYKKWAESGMFLRQGPSLFFNEFWGNWDRRDS